MTKPELKELVKKCLLEIISEDFLKNIINEQVKEKIVVEVSVPGSARKTEQPIVESTQPKKQISEEVRAQMRAAVQGENVPQILPSAAAVLNKIEDPVFASLAADTIAQTGGKIPTT